MKTKRKQSFSAARKALKRGKLKAALAAADAARSGEPVKTINQVFGPAGNASTPDLGNGPVFAPHQPPAQNVQALVIGATEEEWMALSRGSAVVLTHPLDVVCVVIPGARGFQIHPVKSASIEKGKLMVCIGRRD